MKVQLLSDELHERVISRKPCKPNARERQAMLDSWKQSGLADAVETAKPVELPLPEWFGNWRDMADAAVQRYGRQHLDRLLNMSRWELPELVTIEGLRPGWQYWSGSEWKKCQPPSNRTMVLDFETYEYQGSWYPSCAVARIEKTWLVWLADLNQQKSLVPFGKNNTVLGHNVQYERQWLENEYHYQDSGNRFADTMSQWIVTRGVSNQQRAVFKMTEGGFRPAWVDETATNGLDALYHFYFSKDLDKGVRDGIVKGGLKFTTENIKSIISYCMLDVLATLEVFQKLYPEYLYHRPSEVSQTASLLLGSAWVPLSVDRYPNYAKNAENEYHAVSEKVRLELLAQARAFVKQALDTYPVPSSFYTAKADERASIYDEWVSKMPAPWQVLDWTPTLKPTVKNAKGIPQWFRDIKPDTASLHQRWVPIVLGVRWRDELVQWEDAISANGKQVGSGYWYTPSYGSIPHPDNASKPVTDLFVKGMNHAVEEGVLTAEGNVQELLKAAMSTINWVSMRKRVASIHSENINGYPVVLPQLTVNGTVTGRAADKLWQVLANPKETRIGTEIKSMVEAPSGYLLVGADVDAQELDLASWLGDAILGFVGSTPLGLMSCIGDKKAKTDVHSKTATTVGIKRDYAKNLVYGIVYGLGKKGATDTLAKNLPGTPIEECERMAMHFLNSFKGQKLYGRYNAGWASATFNELERIANDKEPKTPLFKNKLTKSLSKAKNDFMTTKTNWVVQSSGVDFRDLMILLQRYFYDLMGVDGRLVMTIHDEIRTCVKEDKAQLAAYALQLVHLCCRIAFIDALGLDGLPACKAWFSAVDVDKYLRKEPTLPCVTPSQPEPLPAGYCIEPKDTLEWCCKSLVL